MILVDPNGKQEISTFAAGALAVGATMTAPYWLSAEGLVAGAFFAISALPNTADAPGVVHDRNLIQVEPDIISKPMESRKSTKLDKIPRLLDNVEEHIDKISGMGPNNPDPHNDKDKWRDHIVKNARELVKNLRQAFRKTSDKDILKYLKETFGEKRIDKIIEGLKNNNVDFKNL